ncbi:lysoplasmalogenase [Treponema pedis]|uniref:lysoplasmalogenase n=1 Tax=Treponema pedis TaxID=409322 RepID=UPI000405FE66|nr:lysoplasmalogenase [Treponema pedis]
MYSQMFNGWCIAAFAIFTGVSIIHLIRCWQQKEGQADISKFMLMPALFLFAAAFIGFNPGAVSVLHILILAALVLSFFGDWTLIFDLEKAIFALGMLFFLTAHLCYITFASIKLAGGFPLIAGLCVAPVYILGLIYAYLRMRKAIKGMIKIIMFYSFILCIMSWLFIILAISSPSAATVLAAVGGILFVISDTMLCYRKFMGVIVKGRFFVMLTYILAQVLISIGSLGMIN